MKLIRGQHNLAQIQSATAVTIGNFDGVHCGHQYIIEQLKHYAVQHNLATTVVMFEPQPLELLQPTLAPVRLTPLNEKIQLLKACAIDYLVCLYFNNVLANMPASVFMEQIIRQQLHTQYLLVGDDFRFGHKREGNIELLQQAASAGAFKLASCTSLLQQDERVSSTLIRQALQQSDFNRAAKLLGRDYSLSGRVKCGEQRGRHLGFPTANIILKRDRLPLTGVFAVMVQVNDNNQYYPGVANIGVRPTVNGSKRNLEVYLFDFNGNLYGQHLRVHFKHKLRDEQRFASLVALKQQIQQDVMLAKAFFLET